MSPESFELARAWLKKAQSDLAAARIMIEGEDRHLDIGVYHCQQTAEKALKAWLTAKEILFPKTHSLEELVALRIPSRAEFNLFQQHAEELTPLAHEFRYPGDVAEPGADRSNRALILAEEVYNFCDAAVVSLRK